MRVFTTTELSRMQATQEGAMMDRCELLVRLVTDRNDEYGMPLAMWVAVDTVCGLENVRSEEMLNAEAHFFDAKLRLPIDTVISNVDRVLVTQRFGVLLNAAVEYELIGSAVRGPSGLVCDLRQVV
jgi:hypothetical protein